MKLSFESWEAPRCIYTDSFVTYPSSSGVDSRSGISFPFPEVMGSMAQTNRAQEVKCICEL